MRELLGKINPSYLLLLAVCFFIYLPGLDGPFIFDDVPGLAQNPAVATAPYPLDALTVTGPSDTAAYGRPLVALIWWTQYQISDGEPAFFHMVSLLLHMANCLLVFKLLKVLLPDSLRSLTGFIAFLWAVHPLLSETVLYASQQTELLTSLMLLGTFNAAVRGHKITAAICCVIGMFCKEWMVVTPLLIWLAMSLGMGKPYLATLKQHKWFYASLAGSCLIVVALMMHYPRTQSTGNIDGWTNWNYLLTQTQSLNHYITQTLKPTRLAIDLWFPRAQSIGDIWFYAVGVIGLLIAWGLCLISKQRIGFWLACFFLILAPTSSIIPITTEIAAERRMYLPMLGLLVFFVYVLHYCMLKCDRPNVTGWLLLLGCLFLPAMTFERACLYQSPILLYEDTVAKFPANRRATRNLGSWYYEHQEYDKALLTYENVLSRWSNDVRLQLDRAIVLIKLNRLEEAIGIFEMHKTFINNDAISLSILGDCYRRLEQWDQAQQVYLQAIEVDQSNNYLHKTFLASTYARQQKWIQAIHWQKQALEHSDPIPETKRAEVWNVLGMYYGITEQYHLANTAFKQAQSSPDVTPPKVLEDARLNQLRALEMIDLQNKTKSKTNSPI